MSHGGFANHSRHDAAAQTAVCEQFSLSLNGNEDQVKPQAAMPFTSSGNSEITVESQDVMEAATALCLLHSGTSNTTTFSPSKSNNNININNEVITMTYDILAAGHHEYENNLYQQTLRSLQNVAEEELSSNKKKRGRGCTPPSTSKGLVLPSLFSRTCTLLFVVV